LEISPDGRLREGKPCENGGGESECDKTTGIYHIVRNDNTCCTRGCTAEHEAMHAADVNATGCCKAFAAAYNAPGADKDLVWSKYRIWQGRFQYITECHAYSNDVACADALAKAKDCERTGKGTDCCNQIADYRERYEKAARLFCKAATADIPPCPVY